MSVAAQIDPTAQARPFLKWSGGKTQLLSELFKHVPASFDPAEHAYYEPFLGGGALFFALQPRRTMLTDANRRLIRTYVAVRDEVERVIDVLHVMSRHHSEEFYYTNRARNPDVMPPHRAAAWLIYMNKTGFNGLYRVNRSDGYNVPWGKHEKFVVDSMGLRACSRALTGSALTTAKFEDAVCNAAPGSLVYLDPPYVPVSSTSNFTAYTAGGFDHIDQQRVANVARELKRRGVHVIVSNAGNDEVRKLYKGFKITEVAAHRSINSKTSKRGPVLEFIIT